MAKYLVWLSLIGSIISSNLVAMEPQTVERETKQTANDDAQQPADVVSNNEKKEGTEKKEEAEKKENTDKKQDEKKENTDKKEDPEKKENANQKGAEIKETTAKECIGTKQEEVKAQKPQNEQATEKNASIPDDGYMSVVTKPYQSAVDKTSKDKSLPLIGHLVLSNNSEAWDGLIRYGFNQNGFTTPDLKWVIKEYSQPSLLKKDLAARLFEIFLAINKPEQRTVKIIELLTNVEIRKQAYDGCKSYIGSHSHTEDHNLLVEMIEHGYFDAFKKILEVFPELVKKLASETSVKREEYKGKSDESAWVSYKYVYETKTYNVIEWLMRNKSSYVTENKNYIEAGVIIIENVVKVLKDSDSIWELEQILFKADHIKKTLHNEVGKKYRGSIETVSK